MSKRISPIAVLAALLLPTIAIAHEGHHHTAMGTIDTIDGEQISLAVEDDKTELFKLTETTSFTRGGDEATREDVTPGERAVVMYETKDNVHLAIEIKLPPKAD